MLTIENSFDLNSLLEKFIKKIKSPEIWNDPFNPPLAVLSDIKVEHWFKLAWIKDSKKDAVLMNLNTVRLESFVFEAVAAGINSDEKIYYENINEGILSNVIVHKLISEIEKGKKYYQSLKSDSVNTYIENKDGSINQLRTHNFAKLIAHLFIEYLNTRSTDFSESSINSKWSKGDVFFNFISKSENPSDQKKEIERYKEIQTWQKKLFNDVLNSDLLTIPAKDDGYTIKYVSLPELIEINKKSNDGNLNFNPRLAKKIFIFGFSTMGQTYRQLLKMMAEKIDLYVYIQANDFTYTESENSFLKDWNKSGNENLNLWKDKKDSISNENSYKGETLLKKIQQKINLKDTASEPLAEKYKDDSLTLTSAPSMLRELEAVYSSICSIIQEKKNKKEAVSFSDFVVLAPSVQEYRVPAMQIFEQSYSNEFPHLPYVFSDYSAEYSAVAEALNILVGILNKKSLYRSDLFSLLRNSVIRAARGFSLNEVDNWAEWVIELNGYRDRKYSKNEWEKAIKRLMLARLTENTFTTSDDVYVPFSNMTTEDMNSLYKFIDAVDKIEEWLSEFKDKDELLLEDIDAISEFFSYWFKLGKDAPKELSGERIVYSEIIEELNNQRLMFKFGNEKINAKNLFVSLCDSAGSSCGSSINLFTGGITFGNFALNRTIPAKYVYILGLDSKAFPGTDSGQTLDLRLISRAEAGDESIQARNKEAFLCQLMATGEKLWISYVNKDLKKDEDFFRSSVIDDLLEFIQAKDFEKVITIDEKRKWEDLYTQRAFRNKRNFSNLVGNSGKDDVQASESIKGHTYPDSVRIAKMKDFLSNPFVFFANSIFNGSEDENAEEEKVEYEPVKISPLDKSLFIKQFVLMKAADPSIDINKEIDKSISVYQKSGSIPDKFFGEYSVSQLKQAVKEAYDALEYNAGTDITNFKFNETRNVMISQKIDQEEKLWLLSGNVSPYYWKDDENLQIVEIITSSKINKNHILTPYVSSLLLIALSDTKKDVQVTYELVKNIKNTERFVSSEKISKKKAMDILADIYSHMYYDLYKKFVAYELIDSEFEDYNEFLANAEKTRAWSYFSKKELFNKNRDFGFSYSGIKTEYSNAVTEMKSLIKLVQE